MRIETERLVLRLPRRDDADDLLEHVGDPEVMRWIGGAAGDRDVAVAAIERWLAAWEANGIGRFVVGRDGRVLGRAGFAVWDRETWEQSTCDRASARAWASAERLISLVDPANERSIRVAQTLEAVASETVAVKGKPAVAWVHPG